MAIQGCPEDSPCSCEFNNPPWFTPGLLKLRDITGPILVHAGVAAVAATSVGTVVFGAGQTARRAATCKCSNIWSEYTEYVYGATENELE